MTLLFSMVFGVYSSFGAILNDFFSKYNFSSDQCSYIGIVFILSGMLGAAFQGYMMDVFKKYIFAIRMICFGSVVATIVFCYSVGTENINIVLINVAAIGFLLLPIIPVGYAFGAELTYPISEAMSNGVMIMFSQIAASALTPAITWVIDKCTNSDKKPLPVLFTYIALVAFGGLISLILKEDLKRLAQDKEEAILTSKREETFARSLRDTKIVVDGQAQVI